MMEYKMPKLSKRMLKKLQASSKIQSILWAVMNDDKLIGKVGQKITFVK